VNRINQLDHLAPIADEMLAGLKADEAMRLRILRAARTQGKPQRKTIKRFAPVMAAAALLICVGAASGRFTEKMALPSVTPVAIEETAAGEPVVMSARMVADLGDGASVRMGRSASGSLFAQGGGEIPVVTLDGHVYRMLSSPQDISGGMLSKLHEVHVVTDQPSLASDADMKKGLSNVAKASAAIYSVDGLRTSTAVAAEVDGSVRLFQRVSYAGRGPAGASLEETFSVRGKVAGVALDGMGELTGSAAKEVIAVLLDCATLKSADAGSARQYLTVTLDSGLKLQLGVSGDTLIGCGAWSCPEFFEAFEKAMQ